MAGNTEELKEVFSQKSQPAKNGQPKQHIRTLYTDTERKLGDAKDTSAVQWFQKKSAAVLHRQSASAVKRALLIALSGFLLVASGFLVVQLGLQAYKKRPQAAEITTPHALVVADVSVPVSASGGGVGFLSAAQREIGGLTLQKGQVGHLYFVESRLLRLDRVISAREFFTQINVPLPSVLGASLRNEFMFGVHQERVPEKFLVLSVASFADAVAGMAAWEPTLIRDLSALLGISNISLQSGGAAAIFIDDVVANQDVRIVRNTQDEAVLVYSFPAPNRLIIAKNEATLRALLTRLSALSVE